MATFPGVYRAKASTRVGASLTAFVPQVFGEHPITIKDFVGTPPTTAEMGWVAFQGGNPEFPVWFGITAVATGGNGDGGGTVTDVVWQGPSAPSDTTTELWWDTNEEAPLDPRYVDVTGDTMTGDLTVPYLEVNEDITIHRQASSEQGVYILNTPSGTLMRLTHDGTSQYLMNHKAAGSMFLSVRNPANTAFVGLELFGDRIESDVPIALPADPDSNLHAATKQYVDQLGIIAYAQVTSNQATITTIVDLTGLSVTFTAVSGRYYKVTGSVYPSSTVAGDTMRMHITDAANNTKQMGDIGATAANTAYSIQRSWVTNTLSGSTTLKLRLVRSGGTGTLTNAAQPQWPSFIMVEDLGI